MHVMFKRLRRMNRTRCTENNSNLVFIFFYIKKKGSVLVPSLSIVATHRKLELAFSAFMYSTTILFLFLYFFQSSVCGKIMELLGQNKIDHHQRQVAILSQDSFYRVLTSEQKTKALKGQFNFDHPGKSLIK